MSRGGCSNATPQKYDDGLSLVLRRSLTLVPKHCSGKWVVCQIGAREHYAIPRALHQAGQLAALVTDIWCPPSSPLSMMPIGNRIRDRWHPELDNATVIAPNLAMLAFEGWARVRGLRGWSLIVARNQFFQHRAIRLIQSLSRRDASISYLFSYSYAANDLLKFARSKEWTSILGQIDPGPEEERIVAHEHTLYPGLGSRWRPAPSKYWSSWREEIALSDRIVVNSPWSQECLMKEAISDSKLQVIPLVYERPIQPVHSLHNSLAIHPRLYEKNCSNLTVLFLGQINLRKGIGRLLDAMRLLKADSIELILAGPTEIDPSAWADLPNVKWIGTIARSAIGPVYENADVFILPTLSDGFAITQLEALAYHCPVLASINCGRVVRDGENGWLLKDCTTEEIQHSLKRLIECRKSLKTIVAAQLPKTSTIQSLAAALESLAEQN